jgi:RimJ/RimL family protein N-acetyltransferase
MSFVVPTLETDRLILRGWAESDFAPLSAFYASDPGSVFVGGPRRGSNVVMWFMARFGQWAVRGYGTFVVAERRGTGFAGWCGVNHYVGMDEPSVQWALAAPYRGKGYMTEAGRAALDFVFEASGRDTLMTTIHPANTASQKTARRLGGGATGECEVDDGETVDMWRFSRLGGAA